jgi:hypothetical protein
MAKTRRRLVFGGVAALAICVSVSLAFASSSWPFSMGARAKVRPPKDVTEVPTTLPTRGVDVNGQVVLRPLAATPDNAMTAAEAIRAAHEYSGLARPVALEASLTVPASIPPPGISGSEKKRSNPIVDVPVWVITYAHSAAFRPGPNPGTPLATHSSIALDATTKKFVIGFFTK